MNSSTRKTSQKRTLKISLRHQLVNLKNVRVLASPMFSELWRQWQPLIFPPIQASNGALSSIKHERCNVVIRVRGCKMTKNSGIALRDANTTLRAFEWFAGIKKKIGVNVAYHTQVPFWRCAVFRKACFTSHYYAGNSIAAAENTFFFKKMERTYSIITRPRRPLNRTRRYVTLSIETYLFYKYFNRVQGICCFKQYTYNHR